MERTGLENASTQDEVALIRGAKAGDRDCFGQLMQRHAHHAYRIGYAILLDQSDAEDAVQEAFVTAFKSISKLEKEDSFGSWLSRIVTTRSYDILRQKKRQRAVIENQTATFKTELVRSAASPSEDKQALALDLQEAIDRLPGLHRLAILLRYSEDASTDHIAAVLDRPAGTVRRILSESYRLLRLHLEGDESP